MVLLEGEIKMNKIKVVKLGEYEGCSFDDRISIEFSPANIEHLEEIFEERSIRANDYYDQTIERKFKDLFEQALLEWKEQREAKEK